MAHVVDVRGGMNPKTWQNITDSEGGLPDGGNSNIFNFYPEPWENDPIWLQ